MEQSSVWCLSSSCPTSHVSCLTSHPLPTLVRNRAEEKYLRKDVVFAGDKRAGGAGTSEGIRKNASSH